MAVFLSPVGGVAAQFFTNTGAVLTGGKLYTYAAGTTTPAATYTSAAGATFNTNPIVLDAAGRVPSSGEIWLTDSAQYKFVLKDSNDVLIATWDNITGINSNFLNFNALEEIQTATAGQTVFTLANAYTPGTNTLSVFVDGVNQYDGSSYSYVETSSTVVTFTAGLHVGALVKFTTAVTLSAGVTSSDLVTYQPAGTGAVATTVQAKLRQYVSVMDFGAAGDGTTDDTAAIQAALNYAISLQSSGYGGGSGGTAIYFPSGIYAVTGLSLAPASGVMSVSLCGNGRNSSIKYTGANGTCLSVKNNNLFKIEDLWIVNAGTGSNTGIALQTTTSGSSSSDALLQNIQITGFTENLLIGSTLDNAASEVLCMNVSIGGGGTAINGIVVKGASPSTNSISLHFVNCAVNGCDFAFRYSGDTTTSNNSITFMGFEASDCKIDFQFDSPCHITVNGHHTEGSSAAWKLLQTANASVASTPMFLSFTNVNASQSAGTNWKVAWPGSYSFDMVDSQGQSIYAGNTGTGDRYQIYVSGKSIPVTQAAGSNSIVFVQTNPSANSSSNNQSVSDLTWDYTDTSGIKRNLLTWDYSAFPLLSGLKFGTQWAQTQIALAYSTTVNVDASLGSLFTINATNGVNFAIAQPTNGQEGQVITIRIRNTSGGALGAVSWASGYKKSTFTNPANGYSRAITFEYIGSFTWVEVSQNTADIPN